MITWMTFLFFFFFFFIKLFTKTSVSRKLENVYNRSRWSQTSRSCSSCLVTIGPNLEGKKSLYVWKVNFFFSPTLFLGIQSSLMTMHANFSIYCLLTLSHQAKQFKICLSVESFCFSQFSWKLYVVQFLLIAPLLGDPYAASPKLTLVVCLV